MALSAGQEFLRMSTDIVAFFASVEINLAGLISGRNDQFIE